MPGLPIMPRESISCLYRVPDPAGFAHVCIFHTSGVRGSVSTCPIQLPSYHPKPMQDFAEIMAAVVVRAISTAALFGPFLCR